MTLHKHQIRNDRIDEKFAMASNLGAYKIPTPMTWPLAQLKSALRVAAETWTDAKQMHIDQHTEGKWDEVQDAKAPGGIRKKFTPDPVYLTDDDGAPKFKPDPKTGEPTKERLIAQGKVQLKNSVLYSRELREIERGVIEISVPHLSWKQLEGKVPSIEPNIIEALSEFFDDLPNGKPETAPPTGKRNQRGTQGADAAT